MIDPGVRDRFAARMADLGLPVAEIDNERPWGGEFIFGNDQVEGFIKAFFPGRTEDARRLAMPKLLLVAPHQRFSWQYHHRRGEIWHVLAGPVGLINGPSDEQPPMRQLQIGDDVEMDSGIRHRLAGLDDWGVVAELWVNADPANPSDEADIVRVEDDYNRH